MYTFFTAGVLWLRLVAGDDPAHRTHIKICEEWLINGIVTGSYPFVDQFLAAIAEGQCGGHPGNAGEI
jgi:hypothetical protein